MRTSARSLFAAACLSTLAALALGCSDEPLPNPLAAANDGGGGATGTGGAGGAGGSGGTAPLSDCDPIVPSRCGFPFPSDRWTVEDATTKTGKRVAFGATTLPKFGKDHLDPAGWNKQDGFSTGQGPVTDMPGATIDGFASQDDIDLSVTDASPTLLIDAATGTRVPHFAELDMSKVSDEDDRALLLRPVVRMKDGTRYLVAIRHVKDASGYDLAPSPAFAALRDGTATDDPDVEGRRDAYDDIFAKLEAAGVPRDELQLAWDYTTASTDNNTAWMLKMRDEALATVGDEGPEYVIDTIEDDPNPFIARRILGRMTVPLYLDTAEPGGRLVFGDDGLPKQNGTAEFEFLVHIPHKATLGTPRALLQNGHGLLGKKTEGQNGYLAELCEDKGYVGFAVDFVGFADPDYDTVVDAVQHDFTKFAGIVERQHQGMLNSLLAMRMMKGRFWKDPAVQYAGVSAIDPNEAYYRGDSQGGIYGTTYMALSTDVTRGLLGEPGAPYNLLLNRSVDFDEFFTALMLACHGSGRDIQIVLGLAQMLWDRTDPNGWLPFITDPLPNTPAHEIMIHAAIGDYQVTPLGAHIIARSVGAKNLAPVNRSIWAIDEDPGPFTGSSIVEFEFGVAPVPTTNNPPLGPEFPEDGDPHDKVRVLQAARDMTDTFLRTGVTQAACTGPCDPE